MKPISFVICLMWPLLVSTQLVPHHVSDFQDSRTGAVGDVDGDGDIDILLQDNGLYWIENMNGLGNFGAAHFVGFQEGDLNRISDVDEDGDMDVITANSGTLSWYENKDGLGGDFEIHQAAIIDLHSNYKFDYLFDLDNDGDLDFLSDGVAWKENLGNFTFGTEQIIYEVPEEHSMTRDIVFIDWDDDGMRDLVIHYTIDQEERKNEISVIKNLGDGAFSDPEVLIPTFHGDRLAFTEVKDVDKDGDYDIALHQGPEDVGWFRNEGSSFSDWIFVYDYLDFPAGFELVDINRDSNIDMVWCGHGGIFWKENKGDFTFDDEIYHLGPNTSNRATNHIIFEDINGDNAIDLVAMGRTIGDFVQKVRWYENQYIETTKTKDQLDPPSIEVYPNPTVDQIQIEGDFMYYDLLHTSGLKIMTDNQQHLDVSHQTSGIYFLKIQTKVGTITKKILIK